MPITTQRTCYCDGRYTGCDHGKRCTEPVNAPRSQYWCEDCDDRRSAHITANLETAQAELAARVVGR
ncbi:MAG: hypothetical protein ACRDRO_18835 [Pseudonocardiaceae bacterium]